jgi:hypothetical protein
MLKTPGKLSSYHKSVSGGPLVLLYRGESVENVLLMLRKALKL